MRAFSRLCLLGLLALPACDSKITETVDQEKIDFINECLPLHAPKLGALLDYAETWRLQGDPRQDNPDGLTAFQQPDGTITVVFVVGGFTIDSTISFYSPTGALQNLTLPDPATSLAVAIDNAAEQLRNLFTTAKPFMVGTWTITGTGVAGSGAFTGIIGGATNGNELESISTTESTPAGGPPPNANGEITISGTDTCTLTFNTTGLSTDVVGKDYPIGTVDFTLSKVAPAASVSASLKFDGTAIAKLGGLFTWNLETNSVQRTSSN